MNRVLIQLDEEIKGLKEMLLRMEGVVKMSVKSAVDSFYNKDLKLAEEVIEKDSEIDQYEIDIDESCYKILALHQPMALDLRFIAGSLKINNDLERIGDFACGMAKGVINFRKDKDFYIIEGIGDFYELGQKMLEESMRSFIERDSILAKKVIEKDLGMDRLYKKLLFRIGDVIKEDLKNLDWGLGCIEMIKGFERIGDHATNIAEQTVYLEKGKIIKHLY